MKRLFPLATIAVCLLFGMTTLAHAALTVHAGEWQTRNGDGSVNLICVHSDIKFDQPTMAKMMAMVGAKCSPSEFHAAGPVTYYNVTCEIASGRMTVHSTITVQGPDAYVTRSQSHFEGGSVKMPDQDMTEASKRVGACKPGDRSSDF